MTLKLSMCHHVWEYYQGYTNYDPGLTMTFFYTKVIFGHIAFRMRKSENYLIFGNYCSLRSQSCLKHLAE